MRKLVLATLLAFIATPTIAGGLSIEMDQSTTIRLSRAATGVVVGNAGVADVIVHDPKLLIIMGKSVGETHVLVVGEDGRTLYSGNITVSAGQTAGVLTVQRGNDIQTSICNTRCIDVPDAESTPAELQQAISRTRGRTVFATGH